jgi:ribosome-associated protein
MIIQEDTRQQAGKHNIKHAYFDEAGIGVVRCKLPFGDYAPIPPVSVDTKKDMDEIANNICGSSHQRFINECKAARSAGCKLIILVENTVGVSDLSQVHLWKNPRSCYSPNCVQGPRLQKAMETISTRYGVEFRFCTPEEAGGVITGIIQEYEQTIRRGD